MQVINGSASPQVRIGADLLSARSRLILTSVRFTIGVGSYRQRLDFHSTSTGFGIPDTTTSTFPVKPG